jgi:hypothetical protein
LYGIGVLLLLARFATGWRALRRIAGAATPTPLSGMTVYDSPMVAAPLTVGLIAPKILLPSEWRDWPEEKLHAVLAHELAHVRRHDPLTAVLAHLNRCLFWFHPLAWWLERTLALTAEHAADDAGVRAAGEKRYAEVLLDMAESVRRSGSRLAWQGVRVANPGLLGQRIERILRGGFFRDVSRTRKTVVAVCCVAAVIIVAACRQRSFYTGALKEDPRYAEQEASNKAAQDFSKAAKAMSPQQVAGLEAQVAENPEDLLARKRLMIYYQSNARPPQPADTPSPRIRSGGEPVAGDEKMEAAFQAHKLWMIGHHPENDLATLVNPLSDPVGDRQAKKLWTAFIARSDASAAGLFGAARFFMNYDKPLAEKLIYRAHALDPKYPW